MVSFRDKFAAGLRSRGIEVCHDLDNSPYDAVLVIGGTRDLLGLWRVKRRGVRIIQRLDGMNWVHYVRRTGLRHFFRAEFGNWLLAYIRSHLVDGVIYQSSFAHRWWERVRGPTRVPNSVVYNGVDLEKYTSQGAHQRPDDRYRILLVEGSLMGGYEMGLENAVKLVEYLNTQHSHELDRPVELMVVGKVAERYKERWESLPSPPIIWAGLVPSVRIPEIDRSAHLLYSADVNAACPNSVVEALACGLPVLSFDTGALPEMVISDAGRIVPYGGDPWCLEDPDLDGLTRGAMDILMQQDRFRGAARERAESAFDLNGMVEGYIRILLP